MATALPPLCPRSSRRSSQFSIESKLSRTSTLTKKKVKSDGLIYLSRTESVSTEKARLNVAPLPPNSYLHRYDSRFVVIVQKGTQSEFGKLEQVQKEQKENNTQSELTNLKKVEEHTVQQQDLLVKGEPVFGPSPISTKNESDKENLSVDETKTTSKGMNLLPGHSNKLIEGTNQLDTLPVSLYKRVSISLPLLGASNKGRSLNKGRKRERLMVENCPLLSACQSRTVENHRLQLMSGASNSLPKPLFERYRS